MTLKEIQELVKLISRSNLTEFKLKQEDLELTIRTNKYEKGKQQTQTPPAQQPNILVPPVQQAFIPSSPPATGTSSSTPPPAKSEPAAEKPKEANPAGGDESSYVEIKSPIVGTFYRSPSPEKAAYVKVGDSVEKGSTVYIVEAMKLFNEIESDVSEKIVKVLVEDAQPVEYDQPLFLVDPKG